MQHYVNIIINSVFIENILLIYFLGMCSFLSISKKVETSIGLGLAVIFVLSITAPANWAINEYLLAEYLLNKSIQCAQHLLTEQQEPENLLTESMSGAEYLLTEKLFEGYLPSQGRSRQLALVPVLLRFPRFCK